MTTAQIDLLLWLHNGDGGQYGECHGPDLDELIKLGYAKLAGEETELDNNFIAKGRGIMFRAVHLTDEGYRQAALCRVAATIVELK